jgi:hypothetical protein
MSYSISNDFIDRIRKSYQLQLVDFEGMASPLWEYIRSLNSELHNALIDSSLDLKQMLENPLNNNLFYGVDNTARDVLPLLPSQDILNTAIRNSLVHLESLLGIRKLFNPEGGSIYNEPKILDKLNDVISVDQMLNRIFSTLKINPDVSQLSLDQVGLSSSYGSVSERLPHALYLSQLLSNLTKFSGYTSFVEIGPGVGRVLLYGSRQGLNTFGVDLPLGVVGSAYYLSRHLGESAISLPGENNKSARIKLLSPRDFLKSKKNFGIMFNNDSFTEMPEEIALRYLSSNNFKTLISVNHEANDFTVKEIANKVGLKPLIRTEYNLRPGYLFEIFYNDKRKFWQRSKST